MQERSKRNSSPQNLPFLLIPQENSKRKRESTPKTPPVFNVLTVPKTPKLKRRKRVYNTASSSVQAGHSQHSKAGNSIRRNPESLCSPLTRQNTTSTGETPPKVNSTAQVSSFVRTGSPCSSNDIFTQKSGKTSTIFIPLHHHGKENISLEKQGLSNRLFKTIPGSPTREISSTFAAMKLQASPSAMKTPRQHFHNKFDLKHTPMNSRVKRRLFPASPRSEHHNQNTMPDDEWFQQEENLMMDRFCASYPEFKPECVNLFQTPTAHVLKHMEDSKQ